eukprot:m.142353 g.142353  ORF g.142353 m.142353 type:complete len:56 (-) comp20402_c0_seq1:43-210(-)
MPFNCSGQMCLLGAKQAIFQTSSLVNTCKWQKWQKKKTQKNTQVTSTFLQLLSFT